MCGIAGFWAKCIDPESCLLKMTTSMVRRGPDGQGTWHDEPENVGLAHTRLSIIDLSNAGRQPMSYRDGRYWITFNGEIYNYREIRVLLENSGHIFTTQTDTEVLLAGWAHWGTDVLTRLRGMFAFAIWDRKKQQLVLCRDRLGIKPLLWSEIPGGIVFASSLKALFASGLVEPIIELQGVFDLLATGSVCQPRTMIRGVNSLEPGTCLVCSTGASIKKIRYWNLNEEVTRIQQDLSKISYSDAVRLVRNLIEESCRYHMIADVPVGSFLSGGVDSTAITALMAKNAVRPVKSFSVGFEESAEYKNELSAANLAAKYIGTEHSEVIITGRDAEAAFDDIIATIDQPSYDGANTYFVSRATSVAAKVAMSGIGGDEIFAGYGHFVRLRNATRPARWSTDSFLPMLHNLRPNRFTGKMAETAALRNLSVMQRYANLRRDLADNAIQNAISDALQSHFSPGFMESFIATFLPLQQDPVTQTSLIECNHYLLNTLLRDADAMSMGHSLEVRPMLLDHILVEHAIALSSSFKLSGPRQKAVFKDAIADLLPPALLKRPKTGFTLPTGQWIRNELRPRIISVLNGSTAKYLFNQTFLSDCLGKIDNSSYTRTLWTLLVFISWIDEFKVRM